VFDFEEPAVSYVTVSSTVLKEAFTCVQNHNVFYVLQLNNVENYCEIVESFASFNAPFV